MIKLNYNELKSLSIRSKASKENEHILREEWFKNKIHYEGDCGYGREFIVSFPVANELVKFL